MAKRLDVTVDALRLWIVPVEPERKLAGLPRTSFPVVSNAIKLPRPATEPDATLEKSTCVGSSFFLLEKYELMLNYFLPFREFFKSLFENITKLCL